MTEHREMSRRERFLRLAKWYLNGWILPPGFHRLHEKWRVKQASRLSREEKAVLSRNEKFRGMYKGRRCFVIGNGPSVNEEDLSPLKHEITITMNFFNRHPILAEWQPTFYCVAEPADGAKAAMSRGMLDRLSPVASFFRIEARSLFDDDKTPEGNEVYYLKFTDERLERKPPPRYILDITRAIPGARNTAQLAIMLAIFLGCSPIYLIGCDEDQMARLDHVNVHFYAQSAEEEEAETAHMSYRQRLQQKAETIRYYEGLRDIALRQRIEIINATHGGFLDVFPRARYEDLFGSVSR